MGDHEADTKDVEEQCGVIKICVPGIREIPCPAPSITTFHTFTASQPASSCKPQPQPASLMSEVPDIIHRNGADPPCMPSCLSVICTSLFIDCLANTAPRTTTNHHLAACCKAMVRILIRPRVSKSAAATKSEPNR